ADLDASQAYLTARLARGESVVLLALVGDPAGGATPVGFTQIYPSFGSLTLAPLWILYDLYVSPEARRGGVGRALLTTARERAAQAGATQMVLQTAHTNTTAQALYESLGWRRDMTYWTYDLDV
ncbi:MAG: GNAT family N-acetyltransferase, partial [Ktedonobacterales bacterium]